MYKLETCSSSFNHLCFVYSSQLAELMGAMADEFDVEAMLEAPYKKEVIFNLVIVVVSMIC